ncbi:hypothetical protein [Comamonas flocculans]|nr:hypothetical protein [Comamonas flocculans]
MFEKILIANRGENGCNADVSPNCVARASVQQAMSRGGRHV